MYPIGVSGHSGRYSGQAMERKGDIQIDATSIAAEPLPAPPAATCFDAIWQPALQALVQSFGQHLVAQLAEWIQQHYTGSPAQISNFPVLVQRWTDSAVPLPTRLGELDTFFRDTRMPYAAPCQRTVIALKRLIGGEQQQAGLDAWIAAAADLEMILDVGTTMPDWKTAKIPLDYLRSLREWSQRIQRLSKAPIDNPAEFFKSLLDQDVLPNWLYSGLRTTDEWTRQMAPSSNLYRSDSAGSSCGKARRIFWHFPS